MVYSKEKSFIDWELETTKANHYLNLEKFSDAEHSYQYAKQLATKLFKVGDQAERATAALVVSYHNLAYLYHQKNELELAYIELSEVDAYLVNYLDNETTNLDVMSAVRDGINKTRAELLAFMKKNQSMSFVKNIDRKKFNH